MRSNITEITNDSNFGYFFNLKPPVTKNVQKRPIKGLKLFSCYVLIWKNSNLPDLSHLLRFSKLSKIFFFKKPKKSLKMPPGGRKWVKFPDWTLPNFSLLYIFSYFIVQPELFYQYGHQRDRRGTFKIFFSIFDLKNDPQGDQKRQKIYFFALCQ